MLAASTTWPEAVVIVALLYFVGYIFKIVFTRRRRK